MESNGSIFFKLFKNIETAIEQLKYIEFKETKLIISDNLYTEFIKSFNENISDMYIVPKIIIFTKNKENFIKFNTDNNHNYKFFSYWGLATSFNEIKDFLTNKEKQEIKIQEDVQLTFEYVDKKEKLILPLFFKTLIDNESNVNIENYTNILYETFSQENLEIKELLGSIASINNIPIEILSRYYSRLYTADSSFYKNINKDLGLNKKDQYLPFIKILYEGIKLKSFPLSNNNTLYRGAKLSNEEIKKIKNYLNKKIEGLPSSIVFSKSFLSFTKDINVAEQFLKDENSSNKNMSKVLFILEKDDNFGYNLSTHADIEKISFYPNEKEVLFFPFSSFEINNINEINMGNEKLYEIKLSYLGKYLKDIENDNNLINNEIIIPNSEFKKQIEEFGLIKINKNQTIKIIYNIYKNYENEINKMNKIIGEINIEPNEINKNIQIINSYENYRRIYDSSYSNKEYENEEEIKENIEIKINEKLIKFSYTYKFEKEGKYKIEYLFKNNLSKTNYLFCNCNSLTNLNLSNFNTKNIINIGSMFSGCNSLRYLNLSNFNTENVTNMDYIFSGCNSLRNLNLSSFNTKNVTNMDCMFSGCYSLINLDLSKFNTENVTSMYYMFNDCKSITYLDLSNFNTKNVSHMSGMFYNCNSLTNLDLSNFNTKNVIYMSNMFSGCSSLTNLNLSNFNTKNVTNLDNMFSGCKSLRSLNLSKFNTKNVKKMEQIFYACNSLKKQNLFSKDNKILNLLN